MSKKKGIEGNEELEVVPADESPEGDEVEDFFSFEGEEYVIKLYRLSGAGSGRPSREWLRNYISELPDFEDIREAWGGGTFIFYTKIKGKLKTLRVNIGDRMEEPGEDSEDEREERFLKRMARTKEILGSGAGGGGNNDMFIKLMETQNKMAEMFTKMMIESEQRVLKVIEASRSNRGQLKDFLEMSELIDDIRGGGADPDEDGGGDDIMDNPLFKALAEKITGAGSPMAGQVTEIAADSVAELAGRLPEAFRAIVRRDNRDTVAQELYRLNSARISLEDAFKIVDDILTQKGV